MTVDIGEPRPTNDGLLYPVTYDGHHLSVLTRLSQDGRLWYVQIKSNFGEAAGNAADPQQAFRIASELAHSFSLRRGISLDWGEVEVALLRVGALITELRFTLTAPVADSLGIKVRYPKEIDTALAEQKLRAGDVLRQGWGVASPHWHVIGAVWNDFGREILFIVHLGATGAVTPD
jgi:hypothetical protein